MKLTLLVTDEKSSVTLDSGNGGFQTHGNTSQIIHFLVGFYKSSSYWGSPRYGPPKSDDRQTGGVKIKQLVVNLLLAWGDVTLQSCWIVVAVIFFGSLMILIFSPMILDKFRCMFDDSTWFSQCVRLGSPTCETWKEHISFWYPYHTPQFIWMHVVQHLETRLNPPLKIETSDLSPSFFPWRWTRGSFHVFSFLDQQVVMVKATLVIASSCRPSVIAWNRCWVKPSVKGSKYSTEKLGVTSWWVDGVDNLLFFSGNNSLGVDPSCVYNFLSHVFAMQVCHFIFVLYIFVTVSSFFEELLGLFRVICLSFVILLESHCNSCVILWSLSNLEG